MTYNSNYNSLPMGEGWGEVQYTAAVNEAKLHDYRYFTLNAPTISDEQYDRLYFAIQDYETAHPEHILPDSPTQSAHAEVKNGHKQIRRRTEMLSTEKAQTIEKVQKWMQKTTKKLATVPGDSSAGLYTVEWKYDGISLSLVYIDGQLTEASYGKGMEGNDCLAHCLKVASIPNTIPASGRIEVRGEMVVPFANLAKTGYKNCRSAASGIMADTASSLIDCLEFHPYWASGLTAEADDDLSNNIGVISALQGNFCFLYDGMDNSLNHAITMAGIDRENITLQNIEQIIAIAEKMRPTLAFPTDGLVIKVSDITKWDSLGRNDHHPHYAIAYKFAAATAETTITRIEITTGKTGKRTPVAYFESVTINGSTYQKASIGSEAKLAELGIESGSRVIVSLRNDVIPHIDARVEVKSEKLKVKREESVDGLVNEVESEESCSSPSMGEAGRGSAYIAPQCPSVALAENETPIVPKCPSVALAENGTPVSPTPYVTPSVTERSVIAEPICASVITPRPKKEKSGEGLSPTRESRRADKSRTIDAWHTENEEDSNAKELLATVIAILAVIAFLVLCFACFGAAIFFLPLLAGAFK